ncbi:TspO/MBR family protein [Allosphingosinicella humi]
MSGLASRSQLRMSFARYALVTVPLVLLLGILSGRAAGSGYGNPWFDALIKPGIMPPGWVFAVTWTILYILLGFALAAILHARGARGRGAALALFGAQLLLNFAWSPLFFAFHKVEAALVLIVAILALSVATTFLFAAIRKGAALLMLPYLGWLCFAAVLTADINALNPQAETLVPGEASADIAL